MKNLRLKSARAAKDLSQQQLADLVSVSRQTINAIEKGDYNPIMGSIKLTYCLKYPAPSTFAASKTAFGMER